MRDITIIDKSKTRPSSNQNSKRHPGHAVAQILSPSPNFLTRGLKKTRSPPSDTTSTILLGDLNLHHPVWGGEDVEPDPKAEDFLEIADKHPLDLWLEPGTITRDEAGHQTTIDLVWGSQELAGRLIACELAPECHVDSDHIPIRILVDISTQPARQPKRRNWKETDTKLLCKFVEANI